MVEADGARLVASPIARMGAAGASGAQGRALRRESRREGGGVVVVVVAVVRTPLSFDLQSPHTGPLPFLPM